IIFGRKMRHKSIDKIIEEVEILLKNNFTDIRFITPDLASYGTNQKHDFTNLKKLVDALKKTIKGKGRIFLGSFPSEIRPEKVTNELAELLKSITSSKTIIIGAQSGSPKILEKINRGHSVEDIINATATLAFYGFKVDIDFMFGFPFETDEDEKYTKELIELLVSKYNSRIHIHYFMPLPGTPFEFLKPKPLSNSMRKYLSGLTSKKIAYGQWENQIGQKS
ncbi:MAG: radical SAM protein, partial [Elusimicrobiales bacterium]|nr:radical SAM protein [Elusimicrobiales bacterium]